MAIRLWASQIDGSVYPAGEDYLHILSIVSPAVVTVDIPHTMVGTGKVIIIAVRDSESHLLNINGVDLAVTVIDETSFSVDGITIDGVYDPDVSVGQVKVVIPPQILVPTPFGDGSDGNATINSDTTLSSDKQYDVLTIPGGVSLKTNGHRVSANKIVLNGILECMGDPGGYGGSGVTASAIPTSGGVGGSPSGSVESFFGIQASGVDGGDGGYAGTTSSFGNGGDGAAGVVGNPAPYPIVLSIGATVGGVGCDADAASTHTPDPPGPYGEGGDGGAPGGSGGGSTPFPNDSTVEPAEGMATYDVSSIVGFVITTQQDHDYGIGDFVILYGNDDLVAASVTDVSNSKCFTVDTDASIIGGSPKTMRDIGQYTVTNPYIFDYQKAHSLYYHPSIGGFSTAPGNGSGCGSGGGGSMGSFYTEVMGASGPAGGGSGSGGGIIGIASKVLEGDGIISVSGGDGGLLGGGAPGVVRHNVDGSTDSGGKSNSDPQFGYGVGGYGGLALLVIGKSGDVYGDDEFLGAIDILGGITPDALDMPRWEIADIYGTDPVTVLLENNGNAPLSDSVFQVSGDAQKATYSSPIVIVALDHGMSPYEPYTHSVTISGVQGNTAANGVWDVTIIDKHRFSLNDSIGNGEQTVAGTYMYRRVVKISGAVSHKETDPEGYSSPMDINGQYVRVTVLDVEDRILQLDNIHLVVGEPQYSTYYGPGGYVNPHTCGYIDVPQSGSRVSSGEIVKNYIETELPFDVSANKFQMVI